MAYEVRLNGAPKGTYDTEEAAIAAVRDVIRDDADAQPEIFDLSTGKPVAPGASQGWREELANRVGF
jgi:hypothetical protein